MIENTKDTTSLKERDKWVTERSSEDIREKKRTAHYF